MTSGWIGRTGAVALAVGLAGLPVGIRAQGSPPAVAAVPPEPLLARVQHDTWAERDGLPAQRISTIADDAAGYLWIGGEHGLQRFDGLRFDRAPAALDAAIGDRDVSQVAVGPDGSLWVRVTRGPLLRWHGDRVVARYDSADGLTQATTGRLLLDRRGRAWVPTTIGLYRVDGARVTRVGSAHVRGVRAAPDGTLWTFGAGSAPLQRVVGDTLQPIPVTGWPPGTIALDIRFEGAGRILLGTSRGLLTLERAAGAGDSWRVTRILDATSGIPGSAAYEVARDAAGVLWIRTEGGLVALQETKPTGAPDGRAIDGPVIDLLTVRDGLSEDLIEALTLDARGDLWIGSRVGLDRIRPRVLRTVSRRDGLADDNVWDAVQDGAGGLWIATGPAIHHRPAGGRMVRWSDAAALDGAEPWTLTPLPDGTVLVTSVRGLRALRAGRPVPLPVPLARSVADSIHTLLRARDGALWLASRTAVFRIRDGRVARIEVGTRTGGGARAIVEQDDGTVWVAWANRLLGFRDTVRVATLLESGPGGTPSIVSLLPDGDALWVGTFEDGLQLVRGGRVHTAPRGAFAPKRHIFALRADAADGLWVGTDAGLLRTSRAALRDFLLGRRTAVPAVRTFGRAEGLLALEFNESSRRSTDSLLWFPSLRGAVWVDPRRLPPLPAVPTPQVEAVLLDERADTRVLESSGAPRGRGQLLVRFTAPDLRTAERLVFRYRLLGYDDVWTTTAGSQRAARFTNVPGGRYTFEVQASYGDGRWSAAARRSLVLQPRGYETLSARLAALLALGAAVWGAAAYRTRRRTRELRAQAATLRALVTERTAALQRLTEELEQRVRERTTALEAEHARGLELQQQLFRAQKLDSIGQLAGGIAHDLNNILSAVITFAELSELSAVDPAQREDLREVIGAAQRAADLTQQLLAFARQQVVEPQVLDLGMVVEGLMRMLGRLLGANIALETRAADDLWAVCMDPRQAEQVLVNLAVNARDAMPDGGRLTITLANAVLDARAGATCGLAAGEYVHLQVRDTGSGMTPEVRARVFEPFFTTKPQGKGTGLGLATTYGIVTQAGGAIELWSEPGAGTRFDLWLPRTADEATSAGAHEVHAVPTGHEPLLLVDDDAQVRAAARRVLEQAGYAVREAPDGAAALALLADEPAPPALVISDVVMPRLGGVELTRALRERWPDVRILLTSGYVERALPLEGPYATWFLRKPFGSASLARRVREVLDAPLPLPGRPTPLRSPAVPAPPAGVPGAPGTPAMERRGASGG